MKVMNLSERIYCADVVSFKKTYWLLSRA